jgi:5-enolpyruvylshikimate-3-phosphate synthase
VYALNRESERLKKVISNLAKVGVKISKTKSRLEVLQSVNQLSSVVKS